MAAWTTTHTARKLYECEGCGREIRRGDRYPKHVAAPNHDGITHPMPFQRRFPVRGATHPCDARPPFTGAG